jgi:hypothetical protein
VPEIRQLHRSDRKSIPGNLIASKPIVLRVHRHFFLSPLSARIRGVWAALIVLMGIGGARALYAQAPAGRPDFSGTWTFDTYLSDNPEQIARALRLDTGQPGDEALGARGAGRGGFSGAGRIGGGRGTVTREERGRAEAADQMSPEDRKKVTELTNAVQFASPTLTITQTENAITLADNRSGTQTMSTNGKAEKYTLDAGPVDRVARWEGPTLLIGYEVGHAGTLTYAYVLVPTKQLLIRVNFERLRGEPGPFEIKLVYNRAPRAAAARGWNRGGARQP